MKDDLVGKAAFIQFRDGNLVKDTYAGGIGDEHYIHAVDLQLGYIKVNLIENGEFLKDNCEWINLRSILRIWGISPAKLNQIARGENEAFVVREVTRKSPTAHSPASAS